MSTTTAPPSYGISPAERGDAPSIARFEKALNAFGVKLRVAMPGVIQSFDETKQTCTVLPAITDKFRIQGVLTTVPIPILQDVPIVVMRAGGLSVTMPITTGDECLVICSDSCIDGWYQSGAANGPVDQLDIRRHDLSDAFAIVGIWNQTRVLQDYSTDSIQIRSDDGETYIDVSADEIQVVAATVSVNTTGTAVVSAKTVQVSAQNGATINAETVSITGSTSVTINGTDWQHHHHSGVQSGGSLTGPVVP